MTINLSNHPQLFLDDHLVSRLRNLTRDVKQPVKHPSNPLFVSEHPWEKTCHWYTTVIYDEQWGKFRAWYMCGDGTKTHPKYAVGYAESKNGLRWTKPMVGNFAFRQYPKHNVVIRGGHGVCVMKTPWDPDPNRLYKAAGGNVLAVSPDGIHWTCQDWDAGIGGNDTSTSYVWWKDQYLAYPRYKYYMHGSPQKGRKVVCRTPNHIPHVKGWPPLIRAIGLSVSKDFTRWTKKRLILEADAADGFPWGQPHGLEVTAYGDVLIGLLPMMDIIPEAGNNIMGEMHVELVVSRDGRKWHRVADRQRFIPQDKPERLNRRNWDFGFHPCSNMLVKDDRVYVYYVGRQTRWGENSWRGGKLRFGGVGGRRRKRSKPDPRPRISGLGLATLNADRFVSLRPTNFEAEGTLITKPLILSGKNLLINAEIKKDELQVELLDSSKKVVPGFGREASTLVRHDKLRYRALWRGGRGGEKTLGHAPRRKPLSLRFTLKNGDFYAFQVK